MATFTHQDWTPVVFHKKSPPAPAAPRKPQQERRLDEETELFHSPKFERAFIQSVIQARLEKKWTQKDLANAIREPVPRIQNFEQGKEIYDSALKARLQRCLFREPKKV